MKRRKFIKFATVCSVLFTSNISIARNLPSDALKVLDEVYIILFPKTSTMPSAKEFGALEFLIKNINHKSFDDYDKTLVLDGAKDFYNSFPEFLNISKEEKSKIIHDIVNSNDYAQSWLSKLIYYGFEALLADPIYGGNKSQVGWNSVNHKIGYPRPKLTYGQKV